MTALRQLLAHLRPDRCPECEVCTGVTATCVSCTSNRAHLHCTTCDHALRDHVEVL